MCVYVYMYVCYICMCISVYVYIYIYVCMCIHTYTCRKRLEYNDNYHIRVVISLCFTNGLVYDHKTFIIKTYS